MHSVCSGREGRGLETSSEGQETQLRLVGVTGVCVCV